MTGSILVVGASGTLGRHLLAAARKRGLHVVGTGRQATADRLRFVLNEDDPAAFLDALPNRPELALICAAESNIDRCRTDPSAAAVNMVATGNLIAALNARHILPVFYSSDLVFSGRPGETTDGYREDDPCMATTAYGQHKLHIEQLLRQQGLPHLTLRLAKLYTDDAADVSPLAQWRKAFVAGETVRCATDQWLTPTWAGDVAKITFRLLEQHCRGTVHVAAPESYTRHDLARRLAAHWGYDPDLVHACAIADFAFAEPRPQDNRLNTEMLKALLAPAFRSVFSSENFPTTSFLEHS